LSQAFLHSRFVLRCHEISRANPNSTTTKVVLARSVTLDPLP